MRLRHITMAACAVLAATAVAGCGEFKNTVYPQPGTTTHVPVMLSGAPNGLMAGVYDAIALGYYRQSDMQVELTVPSATQDPLTELHNFKTEVAVSSEPNVLLRRNQGVPVVSVGAIVQQPLASVAVKEVITTKDKNCAGKKDCKRTSIKNSKHSGGSTTTTKTVTTRLRDIWEPGTVGDTSSAVPPSVARVLDEKQVPNYQGLVFAVRPDSIVNNTSAIRRFLQTTARGYEAARKDPDQAVDNMIRLDPSLAGKGPQLLAQLKAFLPYMFPGIQTMGSSKGTHVPWGFQNTAEWSKFGYWLHDHHLISNPNAVTDASTNELLAGQGV